MKKYSKHDIAKKTEPDSNAILPDLLRRVNELIEQILAQLKISTSANTPGLHFSGDLNLLITNG